jgi:DNA modification methylase
MKQYHKNPRQITERQYKDLEKWLRELGDLSGIVHDLNTDEIIGGNQRGRVFKIDNCKIDLVDDPHEPDEQGTVAHGFIEWEGKRYAYRQVRWTEKQCEQANIVANKSGGSWDFDILANNWELDDLLEWGFDKKELDIDLWAGDAPDDPGAQIDKAEELREKWGVETGQLWQLGDHRLVCGDCTDKAVVERVMGTDRAEMVWTDPPYGVAVGDKNKYLNSIAPSNRVEENLENDTLDEPALVAMLENAFDNASEYCTAGAAWFVAAPPGPLHVLFGQILKDRGIWRQTIQWVKNNATFSPLGVCYHWRAEPIFFGWLPNGAHRFYGGRKQDTVWNIDRPAKSPEHPTMKPVELVERAIENHSLTGEIVLDMFVGSGTTLIACERLNRKCRAVEISPAYCAVAIQRWVDMTGGEPVILS